MKFLLWLIILATLAVGVSLSLDLHTGYVVLVKSPYRIDVSLTFFILSLIAMVLVLYALIKLVFGVLTLPGKVRRWRVRKNQMMSKKQGYLAMLSLIEGQFLKVDRAVKKALLHEKHTDARVLVNLTGAKAAHLRRDFVLRDQYFAKAEAEESQANIAVLMLKAEMLADERRDQEALKILQGIRKTMPKLVAAMWLELRIQQREGNALRILQLADLLEKREALEEGMVMRIRQEAYLQHAAKLLNASDLLFWWHKFPIFLQEKAHVVLVMAKYFVKVEDKDTALQLIENALDKSLDIALLDYYSRLELEGNKVTRQLEKAEAWLISAPKNSQLLLSLGRLCVHSELWGKAQSYFEASLAIHPYEVTHAELGRLLEKLGKTEAANQHYRQSLALSAN